MSGELELLSVKEAAALTHLPETTLYRMIEDGTLPARRYGRRIRIRRQALEQWVMAPETGETERLPTSGSHKVLSITAQTGDGSRN